MKKNRYDMGEIDIAWCPGCGNFTIHKVLKETLEELEIRPQDVVICSGIGQAAKIPHYMKCHAFNGLHGRALPPATGIKAANPELVVIAESGDGDMYGEGGNHFIHTIRRNPNITNIVHNNMVYGLTKGQASPTSQHGFVTSVQVNGVILEPFNPIAVAIALNGSFVARTSTTEPEKMKTILKRAIQHSGYALVDVFHPCVSFNKINTFKWFKENTYDLEETYNPENKFEAFKRASETEKLPLGIFYVNPDRIPFEENLTVYKKNKKPMSARRVELNHLKKFINQMGK
ncbi:2-oxoacid ferredoxin oxidoreductase [bacterium]|nr:2-oxoacid ferredoxin oxidoreductase [bacterium]